MTAEQLRVLVIDDSQTLRRFALRVLEGTGRVQVVGLADTGRGAAAAVRRHRPDVVVLDIHMPDVDGLEATREIMSGAPCPIVVFCGVADPTSERRAFEALDAGAVSLVPKPGPGIPLEAVAQELIRAVEVAATARARITREVMAPPRTPPRTPMSRSSSRRVIVVGASTGGPQALLELLRGLPADGPPVLVVQHIVPGFVQGLVAWLASAAAPRRVVVATEGAAPEAGFVYVAPSEGHLVVEDARLRIDASPPRGGHRPSVDVLFESAARGLGASCVGVLLTGMGSDGAQGLLALRRAGAETIAQDEATSCVYGMPRVARELGAACRVLPLPEIAPALCAGSASSRG
jgi:two-component system chemotaxis response regulator CheB